VTYHVDVYDDTMTKVVDTDISTNSYVITMGTLTPGETYEWNVSASDGVATVWADGAETTTRSFNYIDGIIDPADPYVMSTVPVDGATAVALDSDIIITFNESMIKATVESALDITPAVSGVTYAWNPTQTVLTVSHSGLAIDTDYTVTVDGTDLGGDSLVAGPVPNPFSFSTTNTPPADFSKLAPTDATDDCCEVTFQWEDNGDPDLSDTVTYHLDVYELGTVTKVVDTDVSTNQFIVPPGPFTPGTTYEWNVSATDGVNTVWADGAEGTRWTFNYIDGIVDPADPYIISTVPIDGTTDVAVDTGIVITFNESMIRASVESVFDITPAVTGIIYSWNPTQTVLTVTHDDLAIDTSYTVTVAGTDLGGDPLVAGPVPNPFSFTTGAGFVNPEIDLIYDASRGNIFWIAVPYNTPYATASELIAAINTQNAEAPDSGNIITSVGRWDGDVNPQVFESYDYLGLLGWSGTDFPLEPGEALYLNIAADATFTLEGIHDPTFVFDLPYDALRGNIFWVSVPYNGDFTDAASIIADINASASLPIDSGALVTSIGRWDGTSNPQVFESYDYLGLLGWSGTNYTFTPGEGYFINIVADVDNWSPSVP
ncbi:Ig-like domain-containing protein, partial [Candidatus Margulisiibacteriota bacterium]